MSELKEVMNVMQVSGECIPSGYYKKCEVDAVIAEKDKEIAELKEQVHDYALGLYVIQAMAENEARHNKYKRCLAMAKICEDEAEINHNSAYEASEYPPSEEDYFRRNAEHYERWQKRWLELAEKFKGVK